MSLRSLFGGGRAAPFQVGSDNSALVFVVSADFVQGLHVLLYSMYANNTLMDVPIIVITEDLEVLEDLIIHKAADHRRLISTHDIELFKGISPSKVSNRLRLSWIPKYTFLKWLIFDDYGYDRLIFIDADIVCMKPIDNLMSLQGADIYGCPMFTKELRAPHLGREAISENIISFSICEHPKSRRLNTGILVVGKRLLSSDFRSDLIAFAETEEFSVEQAALRKFLYKTKRGHIRMISPLYNFKAAFLESVSACRRFELMDKIRLLHFAGEAVRPWEKSAPETTSDSVWFCYANEAEKAYEEMSLRGPRIAR
jgi:lipopolysaccharide biosynthesis glycosyltransferase